MDRPNKDVVGRNVLDGRWTFQIIEEYEDTCYSLWRTMERKREKSWSTDNVICSKRPPGAS